MKHIKNLNQKKMIKLAFLLFFSSVINSQNQNEIIQQDNTQEEIINGISVSDTLQIEGVPDSLDQIKPLPEVRKLDTELKKLETGEDFFEFKSSLDILKQQVDSLKKVLSTYEQGKGALPNLDEELLNLIKIVFFYPIIIAFFNLQISRIIATFHHDSYSLY